MGAQKGNGLLQQPDQRYSAWHLRHPSGQLEEGAGSNLLVGGKGKEQSREECVEYRKGIVKGNDRPAAAQSDDRKKCLRYFGSSQPHALLAEVI